MNKEEILELLDTNLVRILTRKGITEDIAASSILAILKGLAYIIENMEEKEENE